VPTFFRFVLTFANFFLILFLRIFVYHSTKSYWALSRHIYRFSPSTLKKSPIPGGSNIHTVNENEQVDSLIQAWNFFTSLIRGADLADL